MCQCLLRAWDGRLPSEPGGISRWHGTLEAGDSEGLWVMGRHPECVRWQKPGTLSLPTSWSRLGRVPYALPPPACWCRVRLLVSHNTQQWRVWGSRKTWEVYRHIQTGRQAIRCRGASQASGSQSSAIGRSPGLPCSPEAPCPSSAVRKVHALASPSRSVLYSLLRPSLPLCPVVLLSGRFLHSSNTIFKILPSCFYFLIGSSQKVPLFVSQIQSSLLFFRMFIRVVCFVEVSQCVASLLNSFSPVSFLGPVFHETCCACFIFMTEL